MSTSDLYHNLGLKGVTQLPGTKYGAEGTIYKAAVQDKLIKCPNCGNTDCSPRGSVNRLFRASKCGPNKDIFVRIDVPRVHCPKCGKIRQIELPFATRNKSYTKRFAETALALLVGSTVSFVAEYLSVGWNMINSILKDWLVKKYSKVDFRGLRRIAIYETYIGRNRKYITIVINLDTGLPIFVGDGKSEAALAPFWELVGKRRMKKIEAVAIDMGQAYIAAAKKHLPCADVVFDRFHVVKLANTALDDLRRYTYHKACFEQKKIIAGTRYLLLMNPENLDVEKGEKGRLDKLLELNTPLTQMYILKENLRLFWDQESKEAARIAVETWLSTARESQEPIIKRLAASINRYKEGILAFYNHPISTGMLEGLNNKIKVLVRRAYGYRDMSIFKLLILAIRDVDPATIS